MTESLFLPPEFSRRDGSLWLEDCELRSLAASYGTPLYVYSRAALRRNVQAWTRAGAPIGARIFYAVKANTTRAILEECVDAGLGFDIVSGGELTRVLAAGAKPSDVVYSGVGKTTEEITFALQAGILCFNVESESELYRISNVAAELGKTAPISLRVNPDVDAMTHPYISTGLKSNKFGIPFSDALRLYKTAASLPAVSIRGIDAHIGSQIVSLDPFVHAFEKLLDIVEQLKTSGIELTHIDLGGGLGICYENETPPQPRELVDAIHASLERRGLGTFSLFFEPGRNLVASCGVLLTRVQFLKPGLEKNFCIVDASMAEMIRPALYEARMPLLNCTTPSVAPQQWDIVGPVCESSDWLAKGQTFSVRPSDILAMANSGAYGVSMESNYNSRTRPAQVMVEGNRVHLIREREKFEDLMRLEKSLRFS